MVHLKQRPGPYPASAAAAPLDTVQMADEIENSSASAEGSAVAAPATEPAFDRTALETQVAGKLAAIRGDEPPVVEAPVEEPVAEVTAEEPAAPAEEPAVEAEPVAEEPAAEESEEEEKPEQPPVKSTGPTLPMAYRRSLKAYDWSDEEIDTAFKANPAEFTVTAQRLHSNRNAELARWADMGRASRPTPEHSKDRARPVASPHVDEKGLVKPVDVASLVEKYGNEEIINEIAAPVNAAIERVNAMLPDLLTGVHSIQASRQEALTRQIDQFFGGDELKTFAEFYGKDSASMSPEQMQHRNSVLETADAILSGAAQQGRKLTTDEALTLAHDSVSGGFKSQAIRKEVKAKVTQRAKSLTLKPSSKTAKSDTGTPRNGAELEARTRSRLSAVFGG